MNEKGVEQHPDPFRIEFLRTEVKVWGHIALVEGESRWFLGKDAGAAIVSNRPKTLFRLADGRWWVVHVHGSEADYRVKDGQYITQGVMHERTAELEREVVQRTLDLRVERDRSGSLLLNILPRQVAEELKSKGHADAKHFDQVTIHFTDFKGFTEASEKFTPQELVDELNTWFKAFDGIITARGIEKIKIIGDAYMCAGGLPDPKTSTPADVLHAALEMQVFMTSRKTERDAQGLSAFEMRVDIHTGPVVAGIVGVKKFQYDSWGDEVNTASRMRHRPDLSGESSGEVGQMNISEATYALVREVKEVREEKEATKGPNPRSVTRQPATRQPVTPQPVIHQPVTPQPVTPQPVTPQPATRQPVTRQPATRQPATGHVFIFTPRGKACPGLRAGVQAKGKGVMEMYFVRCAPEGAGSEQVEIRTAEEKYPRHCT